MRFSILAGEAVHHLRSTLDYIVWELAASGNEVQHSAALEFPIFDREPVDTSTQARCDRKRAGVQPRARQLVEPAAIPQIGSNFDRSPERSADGNSRSGQDKQASTSHYRNLRVRSGDVGNGWNVRPAAAVCGTH